MTNQAEERGSSSRSRRPDDTLLALIVEDDLGQQVVLRSTLEARGLKVIVAGTGLDALRLLSVQEPQLIMLDLGLPDFDGVELCRRMRQTQRCPIIVVTADGDEGRMVAALDLGADDYITKPYGPDLLMARVRVAMRHATALAALAEETTFQLGDLFLDVEAHLVLVDGREIELSPRQFRLLTALLRNAGRVLTHKQLAMVTSSDDDEVVNADGLRGAMSHLRKRLGTSQHRPRIVTEPHVGYRLVAPD
ncbi:MAG TPA: response regulator transcription factor [Ilumatobacteraceae bacterium]|jgi:two-component system KDP operon response regulator KdpE|nr:response regulator transcription factor [Ilumatobacteraceae bacterium]